jgi:hypothetical protein
MLFSDVFSRRVIHPRLKGIFPKKGIITGDYSGSCFFCPSVFSA